MSEAFEIGVSLALDDGVSIGIENARRETAQLRDMLNSFSVPVHRLREVAMGAVGAPPGAVMVPARATQAPSPGVAPDVPADRPMADAPGAEGQDAGLAPVVWRSVTVPQSNVPPVMTVPDIPVSAPPAPPVAARTSGENAPGAVFSRQPNPGPMAPPAVPAAESMAAVGPPGGGIQGVTAYQGLPPAVQAPLCRSDTVRGPATVLPAASPRYQAQVSAALPAAPFIGGPSDQPPASLDGLEVGRIAMDQTAIWPGYAAPTRGVAPAPVGQDGSAVNAAGGGETGPQQGRLPAAPRGSAAEQHGPTEGDVFLDGMLVGRWMSRFLSREAGRASSGPTSFDGRRGRLMPGPTVGG